MASPTNTITLTDVDSVVYFFNESFFIREHDFKWGTKVTDRAFAHGGVDTGDGKVKGRKIRIEGNLFADDDATYRSDYDALFAAAVKENQELRWGAHPRFLKVKRVSQIRVRTIEHVETASEVRVDFETEDPFWNFNAVNSISTDLNSPVSVFTLTNSGNVDTFPTFTIVSSDNNSTGISVQNNSDDDVKLIYADVNQTSGSTLVINNAEGVVTLGAANTLRFFTGPFFRLTPGVNTITYEGGKGVVVAVYRERTF